MRGGVQPLLRSSRPGTTMIRTWQRSGVRYLTPCRTDSRRNRRPWRMPARLLAASRPICAICLTIVGQGRFTTVMPQERRRCTAERRSKAWDPLGRILSPRPAGRSSRSNSVLSIVPVEHYHPRQSPQVVFVMRRLLIQTSTSAAVLGPYEPTQGRPGRQRSVATARTAVWGDQLRQRAGLAQDQ